MRYIVGYEDGSLIPVDATGKNQAVKMADVKRTSEGMGPSRVTRVKRITSASTWEQDDPIRWDKAFGDDKEGD